MDLQIDFSHKENTRGDDSYILSQSSPILYLHPEGGNLEAIRQKEDKKVPGQIEEGRGGLQGSLGRL